MCAGVFGGSGITILPLLVQIIWTFTTLTIFVHCVLVNTLPYHNTVDFVRDSEDGRSTVGCGAAAWDETMARQWERVDEDTAVGPRSTSKFLSANIGVHMPTMETRSSTLAGKLIVAEEPAGGMAFETAQRREQDCSRGRHGRCVGAG